MSISSATTLDNLINLIDGLYSRKDGLIESADEPIDDARFIGKIFFDGNNSDVSYVIGLCNMLLIDSSGGCNWDNINYLKTHGFRVYAGERDSCGWLTGCIEKNDSDTILVFG